MKIDQVAYYCATGDAELAVKAMFGLTNAAWVRDRVTARSKVWGQQSAVNVAELQFNYDLGIELEIIRYVQGPHWHEMHSGLDWTKPFQSHVGIHLLDGEPFPDMGPCKLAQETFTMSHTAPYLTQPGQGGYGRKYHYRIWELSPGHFIKHIRRIHVGQEGK
jgi:hypothetical protein